MDASGRTEKRFTTSVKQQDMPTTVLITLKRSVGMARCAHQFTCCSISDAAAMIATVVTSQGTFSLLSKRRSLRPSRKNGAS